MQISYWVVPLLFAAIGCCFAGKKGADAVSAFTEGCRDGMRGALRLFPTLMLLVTGVSMFAGSGCGAWLGQLLSPWLGKVGLPQELVPFLVLRPVSGSGSMAMLRQILAENGADSFAGLCAAVMMGASDTAVYIVAMYFSAAGMKKSGYALPAALTVAVFSAFLCCAVCRVWFG